MIYVLDERHRCVAGAVPVLAWLLNADLGSPILPHHPGWGPHTGGGWSRDGAAPGSHAQFACQRHGNEPAERWCWVRQSERERDGVQQGSL